MPKRQVPVRWEVASDEQFRRVVARGTELARARLGHSVHAEVGGLQPGSWYWYRFRAGRDAVPGRAHPHRAGARRLDGADGIRPHVVPELHRRATTRPIATWPARTSTLVVQVGDYIYEGPPNPNDLRPHEGIGEPVTLEEYRNRHAQYRSRRRPPGVPRRLPVVGRARRPRDRQQLGRRDPPGPAGAAARRVPRPPRRRLAGLLRAHAAAPVVAPTAASTSSCTAASRSATCSMSTCSTPASTAATRASSAPRPVPHDSRRRAGAVAARQPGRAHRAVERPRPAGVLLAAGLRRRPTGQLQR